MSAPITTFEQLVAAVRELYKGTRYTTSWRVVQRQSALSTSPIWEVAIDNRQLCGDSPEHALSLAKLTLGLEPDGAP